MPKDTGQIIVGKEWIVDAAGCDAQALRQVDVLARVFAGIIRDLNLRTIGAVDWRQFPFPGGVTGFVLLSESHLCCHTYPEFQAATFNLYCCRDRPAWGWTSELQRLLGAESVDVRVVQRSVPCAAQPLEILVTSGAAGGDQQ